MTQQLIKRETQRCRFDSDEIDQYEAWLAGQQKAGWRLKRRLVGLDGSIHLDMERIVET